MGWSLLVTQLQLDIMTVIFKLMSYVPQAAAAVVHAQWEHTLTRWLGQKLHESSLLGDSS